MRLFTDGKGVVLRAESGLVRWKPKAAPSAQSTRLGPKVSDLRQDGLLVISPDGTDHTSALHKLAAIDAVALSKDDFAALVWRSGELLIGKGPLPETSNDVWETEVSLEPNDMPAPTLIDPDAPAELPQDAFAVGDGALPSFGANRWGAAVASSESGIVAVCRPRSTTVDFVLRFAPSEERRIYAEPTKQGALVTVIEQGVQVSAHMLTEKGEVLAQQVVQRGGPPAVQVGERVLTIGDDDKLALLDESLARGARKSISFTPVASAVSADGNGFAVANEEDLLLGRITKTGRLSIVGQVDYANQIRVAKRAADVEKAQGNYFPERAKGSTALGFPVGYSMPAWTVEAGSAFSMELMVRSVGGAGAGILVTATGPALATIALECVRIGALEVPFRASEGGAQVASTPDVELPQGLIYPLDPKPRNPAQKQVASDLLEPTHILLELHGVAGPEPGRELLSLEVRPLDSTSAPMKWTRALTVT